jgi:putative chitinase
LTGEILSQIVPNTNKTKLSEVATIINKYSDEYGLTTAERMSHFIGQIGAESSLSSLKEEYCYSKERAKVIFGKVKYCDLFVGYTSNMDECNGEQPATCTPKLTKITTEMVVKDKYACSLKLFDYVYSCRLGNGTPNSGDGGRFRGRAFLHLTGKEKYETLETKWNATFPKNKKDFTCDSDECEATRQLLVTDLDFAMRSSLAFWKSVGANDLANTVTDDSIKEVSRAVNGGENGLPTRKTLTENTYNILKR